MTDKQMDETRDAIIIEFLGTGTVLFRFTMRGSILPLQMIAVGEYLTTYAKAVLLEQREASRIQVPRTPEPKIILPGQT